MLNGENATKSGCGKNIPGFPLPVIIHRPMVDKAKDVDCRKIHGSLKRVLSISSSLHRHCPGCWINWG